MHERGSSAAHDEDHSIQGGSCGAAGEHSFLWIPCHCAMMAWLCSTVCTLILLTSSAFCLHPPDVSQNAVRCCAATLTSPVACCILPLMTPVIYDANLAVIATADVLYSKPRLLREQLLSGTHCCLAQGSAVAAEMLRGQSKPGFPPPPPPCNQASYPPDFGDSLMAHLTGCCCMTVSKTCSWPSSASRVVATSVRSGNA